VGRVSWRTRVPLKMSRRGKTGTRTPRLHVNYSLGTLLAFPPLKIALSIPTYRRNPVFDGAWKKHSASHSHKRRRF
jgi:hypothetical protein